MNVIDLRPIIDNVVIPILSAVLVPVATAAVYKLAELAHLQISAALGLKVETAMQNGIKYGLGKVQAGVDPLAHADVKSAVVANAVNYVLPKVPGALTKLGITPAGLEQRIEARLHDYLPTPPAA